MNTTDFAALRAERNAKFEAWADKMRAEGWEIAHICANRNPDTCYCDCGRGGPCEHDWTGKPYESPDGSLWSTTCARCGDTSYSHSLRNGP